jgi:hypothetical protein
MKPGPASSVPIDSLEISFADSNILVVVEFVIPAQQPV